ncbi:FAD-binding domain-containing protein [Aureococcus anophagefferens]|nr:FAD-binding domain-containing protein [Aureococcus anophagefferens]
MSSSRRLQLRAAVVALAALGAGALVAPQSRRALTPTRAAVDYVPDKAAPLNVAIAGGGVGGLTTALTLLKAGHDVTVYEKTEAFARFGGPIQFASNALSTLKAIDERLFARVMDAFTFTGTRRCGIKDGLRSDGSFRMTPVADPRFLVDKDTPSDWFVSFPLKQCADFFNLPYTGVVDRPDLQEILLDECRALKPDFIKNGDGVVGYADDGETVTVRLGGGETFDHDLLVGADGIWSAVRAQMYDEGPVRGASPDGLSKQGCAYSGYTVFAGEAVLPLADYYDVGYNVYIGPQRYFVKSDVGDGRVQWYAFCALPPGSAKAGDSWDEGRRPDEGRSVVDYIKGLHEGWTDEISFILDSTPAESGGCQAIEDAYELGKHLSAVSTFDEKASGAVVERALNDFYKDRVVRVAGVSLLSRLASDLIINAFDTPWNPWGDGLGLSWKSYLTFFWKPLLQYVIFRRTSAAPFFAAEKAPVPSR